MTTLDINTLRIWFFLLFAGVLGCMAVALQFEFKIHIVENDTPTFTGTQSALFNCMWRTCVS